MVFPRPIITPDALIKTRKKKERERGWREEGKRTGDEDKEKERKGNRLSVDGNGKRVKESRVKKEGRGEEEIRFSSAHKSSM